MDCRLARIQIHCGEKRGHAHKCRKSQRGKTPIVPKQRAPTSRDRKSRPREDGHAKDKDCSFRFHWRARNGIDIMALCPREVPPPTRRKKARLSVAKEAPSWRQEE